MREVMVILLLVLGLASGSRISVDPDGGYRNIVVKIADNVPEDLCFTFIQNIKVTSAPLLRKICSFFLFLQKSILQNGFSLFSLILSFLSKC